MKKALLWLWDGENVWPRIATVLLAGSGYVTGAGWQPNEPTWIAGAIGVMLASTLSKPTNGGASSANPSS